MKKAILLLLVLAFAKTQAQNFLITFAGKGASTIVDSVKVENLTQCKDTVLNGSNILHLSGVLGIEQNNPNNSNSLRIYPNPMSDHCLIEFESTTKATATFELFDITGKRVIREQTFLTKGMYKFQLDGINSGVYFLNITSDAYCYAAKIISTNTQKESARISCKGTLAGNGNESYATNKTRNDKSIVEMQYTTNDRLKFTGYSSGKYRTIFMQVPVVSQTDTFSFVSCTDADSNHYAVVQIDTLIWMAENLQTTKYNNGVLIGTTIPATLDLNSETSPKYQWAYNGNDTNVSTYGRLYSWYAVTDSRNIAPSGWHVPSIDEWTTLTSYLGDNVAGGKLKENCSGLWISPNTGATNESGFTGLPGGYRVTAGIFDGIGYDGYFWSSTMYNVGSANARSLSNDHSTMSGFIYDKRNGYYVRCIKD